MTRSAKYFLLLLFGMSFLIAQKAFSQKPPLQKVILILDWFPNPNHAPLLVAEAKGYFEEQGLNVEMHTPSDPSDPPKLIAAGVGDIAVGYQPQLILQREQGLAIKRVATLIKQPLNCLVVLKTSAITELGALAKKQIGTSSNGVDEFILKAMIEKSGGSISQGNLINVHYNLSQALLSGKIDAAIGMMRNYEVIQMRLMGKEVRAFFPEDFGIPDYDELIFFVHEKNIEDPRWGKFFIALKKGLKDLRENPKAMWDRVSALHPELKNALNERAWMNTVEMFPEDFKSFNRARYQKFSDFMLERGFIRHPIVWSDYAATFEEQNTRSEE